MALTAIFDIAKTGILTYQKALQVVSHNVANAATEGYTRQDVIFTNQTSGIVSIVGITGRGVRILDIIRLYDSFIEQQLKGESSTLEYWNVTYNGLLKLENIFNEASDIAFSNTINEFFNAWQELSQNPAGTTERDLLLDKARYLTKRLNFDYRFLMNDRNELYGNSKNLVSQINSYLEKINELNEKIAANPGSLDLKDQRENLIKQLNDIVQINYFEDNVGRYSVLLGGMPLVDAGKVYKIRVGLDNNQNLQFNLETESGLIDVTSRIQGGKLKATVDLRDKVIPDYMNKINMFVFDLTEAINAQHRQGYGLDGSTGNNFFNQLYDLEILSGTIGDLVFKINNITEYMYDNYTVQYDGTNWTVTNNSTTPPTTVTVTVTNLPDGYKISFNGIEITIRNPSPTFEFNFQIKPHTALYFDVAISDPHKIAAAGQDPTGPNSGVMDNENARAIYSLLNSQIIGNSTPIDYYRGIVAEIGVFSKSAKVQKGFQEALLEELKNRRQDISGVSLDEEAVNLVKYQKMYEASARMIRVADELLTTLFDIVR
jgi:flagellar hook-associated protein 1 FlgK